MRQKYIYIVNHVIIRCHIIHTVYVKKKGGDEVTTTAFSVVAALKPFGTKAFSYTHKKA